MDGDALGRKRKPVEELMRTITINLKQSIVSAIERDGNVKNVIEDLVNDKYRQK